MLAVVFGYGVPPSRAYTYAKTVLDESEEVAARRIQAFARGWEARRHASHGLRFRQGLDSVLPTFRLTADAVLAVVVSRTWLNYLTACAFHPLLGVSDEADVSLLDDVVVWAAMLVVGLLCTVVPFAFTATTAAHVSQAIGMLVGWLGKAVVDKCELVLPPLPPSTTTIFTTFSHLPLQHHLHRCK